MKYAILLLFVLTAVGAEASPWVAAGYGFRFENESVTGTLTTRNPFGLSAGHRWNNNEAFAEFNTFSTESGNSTLRIARTNQIFMAGLRYYPFSVADFSWYPYFSAGVGGTREIVKTKFLGYQDERTSKLSLMGSVGIGTWGIVIEHVRAGAEFRVFASQEFIPAVLLDLGLRLGFEF